MANIQNIPLDEKLRYSNPKINQNFSNLNTDITEHKNSTTAHKAENITYTGQVTGGNVKDAIDNVNGRISEIVANAGDDNTEIVDARGGYPVLGDRLNAFNAQLSDLVLNVKYPPKPLVAAVGDGVTDDTAAIQAALNYAIANKKTLYFPSGTYLTDTIYYGVYDYVSQMSILGEGKKSTIIKKKTADGLPLLQISDTTATNFTSGLTIADITFKGVPGNTADVVAAYDMVRSVIERCVFSDGIVGFRSNGGIANEFRNCVFTTNQFGIALNKYTSQAGGGYPNLNTLSSCQFVDNTTWGIWFNGGRVLNIDSCDVGNNGTTGVGASGGIFVGAGIGSEGGLTNTMGINVTNTWFEANKGNASVQMSSGKNSISNCYFVANSNATYDVRIIGGKYNLFRLIGDLPKPENVYESEGVAVGNFITDCQFSNMTYDANKTTVTTNDGRVLRKGGEVPTVKAITSPLIQQGIDNTASGVVNVTFPTPYSSPPRVFTQPVNNSPTSLDQVEVYNVTATGFTVRKKTITSGSTTVGTANYSIYWLSIGSTL